MTPDTDDNLCYSVGDDRQEVIADDFIDDDYDDYYDDDNYAEQQDPYEKKYGALGDAWLEDNYQDNLQAKFRGESDW